jgi:hypothetical protein
VRVAAAGSARPRRRSRGSQRWKWDVRGQPPVLRRSEGGPPEAGQPVGSRRPTCARPRRHRSMRLRAWNHYQQDGDGDDTASCCWGVFGAWQRRGVAWSCTSLRANKAMRFHVLMARVRAGPALAAGKPPCTHWNTQLGTASDSIFLLTRSQPQERRRQHGLWRMGQQQQGGASTVSTRRSPCHAACSALQPELRLLRPHDQVVAAGLPVDRGKLIGCI